MTSSTPDLNAKKWTVFSLVAVGVFMCTLDSSIVNIALPRIVQDFTTQVSTIQWVVMIYLLTVSALLLFFGRLSDIKTRRWVYCRGMLVFSMGSLLCGTALSPAWLIFARCFQGIGAAMIMACSQALVVDVFPVNERGRALGIVGTVVASGLTTGPAIGGVIMSYFSWRTIFLINIPIGLAAFFLSLGILKHTDTPPKSPEPLDISGAVLICVCFTSFLLFWGRLSQWGLDDWKAICCAVLFLVSAGWLARVEKQSRHPVFDVSLVHNRLFFVPIICAVLAFATLFTIVFLMPFYLMNPMGYQIGQAGLMMMIPFGCQFLISPFSGALYDRFGSRILCTLGMLIMSVSMFLMARLTADAHFGSIAFRLGLFGVGMSLFLPPNSATAMNAVPRFRRGIASSTVATARNLGMAVGVALAGLVFSQTFQNLSGLPDLSAYHHGLEIPFMAAFKNAMLLGLCISSTGIVAAYLRGPELRGKPVNKSKSRVNCNAR